MTTCPSCSREYDASTQAPAVLVCWSMLTDVRSIACFVRCAGDVVEPRGGSSAHSPLRIQNRAIVQRAADAIAAQILKHFATRGDVSSRDDATTRGGAVAPRGSPSFGNVASILDATSPLPGSAPRAQRDPTNADARES